MTRGHMQWVTSVTAFAVVLIGCGPPIELGALDAMGVRGREIDIGWYQLESADGYRFEMPGVPIADREQYSLGRDRVEATFYDLAAEMSSRAFLLRAFDVSELGDGGPEQVRQQAEEQMARSGDEVSSRREAVERGITMHEIVVEGLSEHGHRAWVRTFVEGAFVFQATGILAPSGGDPTDVRRFFRSIRSSQSMTRLSASR